eukprot:COSAG06_NODE_7576_length_2453_cov_8.501699_2_plen_87_part_00
MMQLMLLLMMALRGVERQTAGGQRHLLTAMHAALPLHLLVMRVSTARQGNNSGGSSRSRSHSCRRRRSSSIRSSSSSNLRRASPTV